MSKNQSIKSFFTSNATNKQQTKPSSGEKEEKKPDIIDLKSENSEKEAKNVPIKTSTTPTSKTSKDDSKNKSKKASAAAAKQEKETSEKSKEEVESSSDFDDSPIKSRNVSMNESVARKRKLILESDDSDPGAANDAAKKTQKKSSPSPQKSSTSKSKENNKENEVDEAKKSSSTSKKSSQLRLSSSEDEANEVVIENDEDVIVEKETTTKSTRGRKKGSTNAAKKEAASPKTTKMEKKSESPVAEKTKPSSKKETSKKDRSESPKPAASKNEKASSPKAEKKSPKKRESSPDLVEVKKSPAKKEKEDSDVKPSPVVKDVKPISNFFSKSTSNFANGKKVQPGEKNETETAATKPGVYSPSKDNYHPIKDATWEKGQPVPYQALAQTLYCMEKTTKRLELLALVSNYFRSLIALSPKDLVPSIFMLTNKVAPDYENIELGIGDTVLFKALAEATGCTVAKLKTEFQVKGDIGLVAEANRCTQKLLFTPKKLTVTAVFTKLKEIASISGNSSQAKKSDLIKNLLVSCDSIEARYLMRSLAGKLRNGLGEQSILMALGQAFATTQVNGDEVIVDRFKQLRKNQQIDEIKKELEEPVQKVKQAYFQCPNYDVLIEALVKHGPYEIDEHCKIVPGIPLKPMLAYPTKGIHEVLKRFDKVELTCEYKYDGERAQIHILEDGSIKIYSRNSENNTSKYPDVIEFLKEHLKLVGDGDESKKKKPNETEAKSKDEDESEEKKEAEDKDEEKETTNVERQVRSAILDAEVVAYDIEKHIIQPFQKLTTRKRKDATSEDIKVQVCIFAFDLIFLNGKSLIHMPLRKRRDKLYKYFPRADTKFLYAERIDTRSSETIQEFLDKSIKDGCEGLMIKTLDEEAHYEISKRSHNWLKLKKDYLEGVGDTLDLVPIGGYHGTGKRTGVYGGYLLACYDKENEEYQTICKMGVGLKDNDLQTLFESLSQVKIDKPKSYYRINKEVEQPDVWFEAEQVWEIKCADFSLSPVHTAACGMIDSEKGVSMRFPRFLRVRDDKKPEDATTSEQVVDMYKNQQQMINQLDNKGGSKSDNEDELD